MKKRVINKKTKKDELITKSYLDKTLDKRFGEFKVEMKSELEVMFKEQNLKIMNGFEQVVSNITGGFNDENVDIKKRVTVLETKVKVLENK